jgi:hypothetical protein
MNTRENIEKRFEELADQIPPLKSMARMHGPASIDTGKWYGWCISATHLLKLVFGDSSVHFTEFKNIYDPNVGGFSVDVLEWLNGIFLAAKADFEGGYAITLEASIAGEIFADFVALAKEALNQKQKDVAAVLGCAALEDTLKRLGAANGLDVRDKEMADVVNAIKAAKLVGGGAAKLLSSMPKIRNYALHANWDNITEAEVGGVIGFVEQLILLHFSPS